MMLMLSNYSHAQHEQESLCTGSVSPLPRCAASGGGHGYISSLGYFADDNTSFMNDQYQTAAVAC